MKELKISGAKTLDEKMEELKMEEIEILEEKNEFWCLINACGANQL